jgi:hypothetical protein
VSVPCTCTLQIDSPAPAWVSVRRSPMPRSALRTGRSEPDRATAASLVTDLLQSVLRRVGRGGHALGFRWCPRTLPSWNLQFFPSLQCCSGVSARTRVQLVGHKGGRCGTSESTAHEGRRKSWPPLKCRQWGPKAPPRWQNVENNRDDCSNIPTSSPSKKV